MKFADLMRVRPWVNPIVFGNHWPNRTTDTEEHVSPKTSFLAFIQPAWNFLRIKLINSTVFSTPFPAENDQVIFVVLCDASLLHKWSCPQKLFFVVILEIF